MIYALLNEQPQKEKLHIVIYSGDTTKSKEEIIDNVKVIYY